MGLTTLKMPQLGESVTEGTVDRWLKQEGEVVRRDEPIVEVVTDKVNAEIPSPVEGRLVRIKVSPGETVPIGAALAELEVEGVTAAAEDKDEAAAEIPPRPQAPPAPAASGRISSSRKTASRSRRSKAPARAAASGARTWCRTCPSTAPQHRRHSRPGRRRGRLQTAGTSSFGSRPCAARSRSTWCAA